MAATLHLPGVVLGAKERSCKNTMNYNALRVAHNNIFTIPFLATKGVALMGIWLHRNLLTMVVAFPARVNSHTDH